MCIYIYIYIHIYLYIYIYTYICVGPQRDVHVRVRALDGLKRVSRDGAYAGPK